jgi:hypothetical protein
MHIMAVSEASRKRLSWVSGSAWIALATLNAWSVAGHMGAAEAALESMPGGKWGLPIAMAAFGLVVALSPRRTVMVVSIAAAALVFARYATWVLEPGLAHELSGHVVSAGFGVIAGSAALLALAADARLARRRRTASS